MIHLIAPSHSEQFLALPSKHWPSWREARAELNGLPLGAVAWNEEGVGLQATRLLLDSWHQGAMT